MNIKIELLKALFNIAKHETKIDHTEWIEADNLDEIRLFAPTDALTGKQGEIEVENEHGSVYSLDELSEDEIDVFIFSLK